MRPILIASILALGLLVAPVALAARDGTHGAPSDPSGGHAAEAAGNNTTGHPSMLDSLLAAMKDARSGCRDTTVDHANMTHDAQRTWAHCIRDAYHGLFESIHWRHHEAKAARLDAKAAKPDA